jgi:hypothetical protein
VAGGAPGAETHVRAIPAEMRTASIADGAVRQLVGRERFGK